MHWNIDFTKTSIRPGESLGLDCTAMANDARVDMHEYDIYLKLKIGSDEIYNASTDSASQLPLYVTKRNSVVLNLASAQTKRFSEGRLNVEIKVKNKSTGVIWGPFSVETVRILSTLMSSLV